MEKVEQFLDDDIYSLRRVDRVTERLQLLCEDCSKVRDEVRLEVHVYATMESFDPDRGVLIELRVIGLSYMQSGPTHEFKYSDVEDYGVAQRGAIRSIVWT